MTASLFLITWKGTLTSPGGSLAFDAIMSETYDESSTITDFPVESGANINDHIRSNPERVTCDAWVTDTPHTGDNNVNGGLPRGSIAGKVLETPSAPTQYGFTGLVALAKRALGLGAPPVKAQLLQFATPFSAITETHQLLSKLREEGRPLELFARDWFADNMVIESISKPRAPEDGSMAHFAINFKRVRIVETRVTVAAVPAEPRGKGKVDAGKKDGSSSDAAKKSSLLAKGAKYLGVLP